MITAAEAFSGTWALNVRGWLWTVVPTAAVAFAQGLATPGLGVTWAAASAGLQLVVAAAWAIAVVTLSRVLYGRVVPVASGLFWLGYGLLHGLVGGAVAAWGAGVDPELLYRLTFWVVAAGTWMPLITYTLAQWDQYRVLLAEQRAVTDALRAASAHALEDAAARDRRLTDALSTSFTPSLTEIRAQLSEFGGGIDADTAHTIAACLDDLAGRAADLATTDSVELPDPGVRKASVAEASVDFELGRPLFASVLTAALIAPPLLPEAYREGGPMHLAEMAIAILVSTIVLAATFGILRPLRFSGRARSLLSRVGVLLAGLAGPALLITLDWHPLDTGDIILLALFPVLVILGASLIATAVALWAANTATVTHIADDRAALAELQQGLRGAEDETAARVHMLARGELNGRLASCAMALAFLTDGDHDEAAQAAVIANVLQQLDTATAELRAVAGRPTRRGVPPKPLEP